MSANLQPTVRELDVLAAVLRHSSVKRAAAAMGLKPTTVNGCLQSVFRKLDVSTRDEAAQALGWLVVPRG